MANPVLGRSSMFSSRGPAQTYGAGYGVQGYDAAGYGALGYGQQQAPVARMTYDDVIAKTGITLLAVLVVAFASFRAASQSMSPALLGGAFLVSAIAGFITVLIVSARRRVSPVGVLVYALFEGVFIGLLTALFEARFPGIAVQAVGSTFAAAACTLAAYHYLNIRVTPKFRKVVLLTTVAFAVVMLANLVLAMLGIDTGLRSIGGNSLGLAALVAAIGAGLAVMNLIVDFDYVENAVRNGAPASESWRAALGITVTMVWLYSEILRLLSYARR